MTQGLGVLGFFALSVPSFSLALAASSSSGEGSRRTKKRRRLSGEQSNSSTSSRVYVSFCASPPSRLRSQTWVLPSSRAERNASHLPSGLQRGWEEETPSAVRGTGSPPATGTIQMRSSVLSSLRFVVVTV